MMEQKSRILLVEDDEDDVFLMQRAMSRAKLDFPIHIAPNGQDAIDYLAGRGKYADRNTYPLPFCMFLDLKLPFVHGFEVLEWMREQELLEQISVLVLTSSPEDRDRVRARELGAKAYLVKPPTPEGLREVLKLFPQCAPAESN